MPEDIDLHEVPLAIDAIQAQSDDITQREVLAAMRAAARAIGRFIVLTVLEFRQEMDEMLADVEPEGNA